MSDEWVEKLSCAIQCHRCDRKMEQKDERILSVYDHEAICMECKKEEEQRSDYEEVSKRTIGQCLVATTGIHGDPAIVGQVYLHPTVEDIIHAVVISPHYH